MALADGDSVIVASSFNAAATVADLSIGSLCPEGLNVGSFQAAAPYTAWSSGVNQTVAFASATYRKCTTYSGTNLLGKRVRLTGTSTAFDGVVVQQLNTELDNINGTGNQVPVVVVKTGLFYYVVEPDSLEEL